MGGSVTFLGHSTVLVELDGVRLLTDPLLRDRVLFLRRRSNPAGAAELAGLDAVLISHQHADHLDRPSLRSIDGRPRALVPRGAGGHVAGLGLGEITELAVGERAGVGPLEIEAVPAAHHGRRWPWSRPADAVGYVIRGSRSVYFAGDTDLFDGMAEIGPGLDLALVPVWGWGTAIGLGHLDPDDAAQALRLLRPRIAVPIHWGSVTPIVRGDRRPELLTDPPHEFARRAAELAPEVEVRVLQPGESLALG